MKKFLKKNWSNIMIILLIVLLIIPQTRKPMQVGLNRLISFAPSEISEGNREVLETYNWDLQELGGPRGNFRQTKGKVVVLNFWATWCPPCIAEMPSFQDLYDDYGDRVAFYFVSTEEQEKLRRFLQKHEYDLPVYRPLSVPPEQLQDRSLPTTFVISRSGEIAVKKTGSANWNSSRLRELLDELLEE